MDMYSITPEQIQEDYPDDAPRGLVQIFSKLLTFTSIDKDEAIQKPLLIIMDDFDMWLPSSSTSADIPTTMNNNNNKTFSSSLGKSVFTPKDDLSNKPKQGGQRAYDGNIHITHILFYYLQCINYQEIKHQKFGRKIFFVGITIDINKVNSMIHSKFQQKITFYPLTVTERIDILTAYLPSSLFSNDDIQQLGTSTGYGFYIGDLLSVLQIFLQLWEYSLLNPNSSKSTFIPYTLLKSLLISHTPYIMSSTSSIPLPSEGPKQGTFQDKSSNIPLAITRLHRIYANYRE